MKRVYEYTRNLNGEARLEIVMLLSKDECDFDEILHRVGLEFCLSLRGKHLQKNKSGMTFGEFMDYLTPEMLEPYGVVMYRLRDGAQQMDGAAPLVSHCEMELFQKLCDDHIRELRGIREYGERIAKRLETQRTHGHPAISTWDSNTILGKAIVWACLFVNGGESDFMTFFNRKLGEAKPHAATGVKPLVGTDAGSDDPAERQATQAFQ